jgi:hypothetical protein
MDRDGFACAGSRVVGRGGVREFMEEALPDLLHQDTIIGKWCDKFGKSA